MPRGAVICISHGGGPLPVLGDPGHKDIIASLKARVPKVLRLGGPGAPRAIVVVTAHWSEPTPSISSGSRHSLLYDYGGFPKEAYSLKYDAPGAPEVAEEVRSALAEQGLKPVMNDKRGWDHGVFIPFLLIRPAADIPIVQLSVLSSEDPAEHFKMGAALATLRDSNIAIVGSGFASFHNLGLMRQMMGPGVSSVSGFKKASDEWNAALAVAVMSENSAERLAKLGKWRDMPHSYQMHPPGGGEHFMPLLVCAAAGENEAPRTYKDDFWGVDIFTFYWGGEPVA